MRDWYSVGCAEAELCSSHSCDVCVRERGGHRGFIRTLCLGHVLECRLPLCAVQVCSWVPWRMCEEGMTHSAHSVLRCDSSSSLLLYLTHSVFIGLTEIKHSLNPTSLQFISVQSSFTGVTLKQYIDKAFWWAELKITMVIKVNENCTNTLQTVALSWRNMHIDSIVIWL